MRKQQKGFVVIMALLLAGFFIAISLALAAVFIPKIKVSRDVKNSSAAIYAAESAVEWCLYTNRYTLAPMATPTMSNGATYINVATGVAPVTADCATSPKTLNITGTYQNVTRTYQVSF